MLASGGDCKISVDTNSDGVAEDLVVWTKHLTQFVTYSQTKVANPTFSTLKLLKSDGQYLAINWQGTGAEKYLIKINDGIYETVLGNSSDIGTTYHLEYKILNNGSYTILVTAKIGQVESIGQMAQTAIFTAESLTVETGNDNLPNPITPSTAKAAEPSVSMPVIPDANGQIKGVETTPAGDQIDWSPWIVLFIIILLAGLATAGYTYWNTGKEEGELEGAVAIEKKREEDQEEGRKSRLKQENGQKSKAKDQNIKNNKRW
ncbi:MAG: hypothetical protein NTW50_05475 [Candidatus Berkelbacteria bacterium]|nr:hypothetical protein [Candidatus Berkelbacteria bacterium]